MRALSAVVFMMLQFAWGMNPLESSLEFFNGIIFGFTLPLKVIALASGGQVIIPDFSWSLLGGAILGCAILWALLIPVLPDRR